MWMHTLFFTLSAILLSLNEAAKALSVTFVTNAVQKGAVCLDGSPAGYYFSPGFGSGINNWVVHMEGGGWCSNEEDCIQRKSNFRGSTNNSVQMSFSGILGSSQPSNPAFYNWNKVKIRYCDGSSFTGDKVAVDPGSAESLPASCTSRLPPILCFFPQYVVQTLRTPLYVLNAAYDAWQIRNILAPSSSDSKGAWKKCKLNINLCSSAQAQIIQGFRTEFLDAVSGLQNSAAAGLFIDSCHAHCQSGSQAVWLDDGSTMINHTAIGNAVADWFYDRKAVKLIDSCTYPCNPTCHDATDETNSF